MSHEEAAGRLPGKTARRPVKFQAVIEDLEGRVLLSTGTYQIRAPHAQIRAAQTPRLRMRVPRLRLRPFQLASLRQGQTINITPSINIQNNVPGTGASGPTTVPAAATPAPTGATTVQTPKTLTPQGSTGQSWPASVAPSSSGTSGTGSAGTMSQNPSSTGSTAQGGQASQPNTSGSTGTQTPQGSTGITTPAQGSSGTTTPPTPAPVAPSFAEGALLINSQTGEIAQYSGGTRHLVSPPVAAKMGLTSAQLTAVATDKFNLIPQGQDYFPEGMFLRNAQTGEISRYSNGSLRWVSVPVATRLGLTGNDVVTITADQYNKIHKSTADYFEDGMLIQNVQTGEVDIYMNGQRRWISVPVAAKMNLTAAQVTTISSSQFHQIPQGGDYFPEGAYLQNQVTGEIAQYSNGYNHVISAPVALVMGLNASQWISVSPSQYNNIPQGSPFYPEGIFLQNNQTGEVSQLSGGQRHVVSPQAALAIGLTGAQVAAIGADQYNALPLGGDFVPPAKSTA